MKLKVDENLSIDVAAVLKLAGHDAETVLDEHLGGRPDPDIASVCKRESRALLTLDLDFGDIRRYPPADYAGLIVLRLQYQDGPHVVTVVERMVVPLLAKHSPVGALWVVDEKMVRIRS